MSNRVSLALLIGIVLSILMGVFSFLFGGGAYNAIIIGLLSIVVTLLVELARSLIESKEQILCILDLTQQISNDEFLKSRVNSIVESFSLLSNGRHQDLFINEGKRSLTNCRDSLKNLADGTFLIDEERRMRILIELLENAKPNEQVFATSYVNLSDWWKKELGRKYLQANYAAVERQVQIERVFIIRDEEKDDVYKFIDEQRKNGIKIRVVKECTIKPHLKENFFLLQNSILSYSEYSRDGQLVRGYNSQDPKKA